LSGDGGGEFFLIQQVGFDQTEIGMPQRRLEKRAHAGGEIVVSSDLVAVAQQAIDQMTTDESRGAGDETSQRKSP